MKTHSSRSPRTTMRLAARMAAAARPGDVFALIGDLGAGKTCFVRGFARGLDIPADVPITSPTFTVVNTYEEGRVPLYHCDLYRLQDEDELEAIGYRDLLEHGVVVVEWADRVPGAMPPGCHRIEIAQGDAPNARLITISRPGLDSDGADR